jgi:hypothetical protein
VVRVRAGGVQALKHLYVYVDHAGTPIRLNAKRAWTGPLFEASAAVKCAVYPRSRPEQQRTTEIEASLNRWLRIVMPRLADQFVRRTDEARRCQSREDGEAIMSKRLHQQYNLYPVSVGSTGNVCVAKVARKLELLYWHHKHNHPPSMA